MLTATSNLALLRTYYEGESKDLFRVAMNATSLTEANLAFDVLRGSVPEKPCVVACNLREVLREIPGSPFPMRCDEQTLASTAGLERRMAAMGRTLPDGIEIVVTTAGNLVLDLIVKYRGEKYFWTPANAEEDFISDEALDLVVTSDHLLEAVIEIVSAMGVVFNPKFYLSMSDWHMEHVSDVFAGLGDLF
ncbi:MAG: hypothetical protein HGB10_11980 [Coriobacteriia bacterium]|nr:hypothetical protein [Coriobacteriia bacterium]